MRNKTDLINKKFGRLTVLKYAGVKSKNATWRCLCECGALKTVNRSSLISGQTKSCGCYKKDRITTHGKSHTRAYDRWHNMKQRCNNPNTKYYYNYGGRGIKYCEEWEYFENFYKDMGDCPKGCTLERVDNNKGYTPENCKWATREEQNFNKRNSRNYYYRGKKRPLKEIAEIKGITYNSLLCRLLNGWSIEKAFNTP